MFIYLKKSAHWTYLYKALQISVKKKTSKGEPSWQLMQVASKNFLYTYIHVIYLHHLYIRILMLFYNWSISVQDKKRGSNMTTSLWDSLKK